MEGDFKYSREGRRSNVYLIRRPVPFSRSTRSALQSEEYVGVGMPLAEHPLHRSRRAALPHRAPTSGNNAKTHERIRMTDARRG